MINELSHSTMLHEHIIIRISLLCYLMAQLVLTQLLLIVAMQRIPIVDLW